MASRKKSTTSTTTTCSSSSSKSVFVTVGTTSFDALIQALDSVSIVDILRDKGYSSLTLQIGRGSYTPRNILPPGSSRAVLLPGGGGGGDDDDESSPEASSSPFVVECFDFRPSLDQAMRDADLVVSHAGAGSVGGVVPHRPIAGVHSSIHSYRFARSRASRRRSNDEVPHMHVVCSCVQFSSDVGGGGGGGDERLF